MNAEMEVDEADEATEAGPNQSAASAASVAEQGPETVLGVLHRVAGPPHHPPRVRQPVGVRAGGARRQGGGLKGA